MKSIIRYIALGGLALSAAAASAQFTNSGYFVDNYTYRYQLNPAMGNDRGFVSMPALGNLDVAARGNLHVSSLIYNRDGRTVLFTNPGISADEVLGKLNEKNRLGFSLKENILSVGFKAFKGYNTISLNARAEANVHLPKSIFSLIKEGITNRTYDIKNLRANALGYGELALNHSHDISMVPGLRVGGAVKFIVPMAAVDAYFNEAHLTLGQDNWIATTDADVYMNMSKLQYETKVNDKGQRYVSGVNTDGDKISTAGFGVAFDLGATYRWRDFQFSAAVLDLGWINLSDTKYASTNGPRTVETDKYIFSANGDASNSFENEWDKLRDDLEQLYQLTDNGVIGSRNHTMAATLNFAADYQFPLYKKLHFGLLSSTRLAGEYTWTEVRLSANVSPVKCFSADANIAMGTYGFGFGWMLSYSYTGFNIFLGMDHTLGKVTKQFVPLNSNAQVNLGINFPF